MKNMKIICDKNETRAAQSVAYYLAHKFDPVTLTFNLWPWKSTEFQIFLQTKYVPSLVKIYWRMLILDCSQGYYGRTDGRTDGRYRYYIPSKLRWRGDNKPAIPVTLTFDLWPWKSIVFQILLRTKYVPSLVTIHWRMLNIECSQGCYGRTQGRIQGGAP